ncbi:MAG: TolC family protein, partial [Bacteroidales bacterium]|nr:TolC family protein [Bacteroidales bacterium]
MKHLIIILFTWFLHFQTAGAQTELRFSSLDSLLNYAEQNSITIKTTEQQALLAKWQKISAQTGLVNFRISTNFNLTNNIELPVSFLPGEAFGGASGTFKEVTMGQQYIGNLNIAPQIDIINPAAWAKLQGANKNSELTAVNNLLAKKSLFESISAAYHNIVSLQEQIELTGKSLLIADTLHINMENKYSEGIVRQQDLNDAKINKLSLADKLKQFEVSLQQQYLSLKILCDIPENISILIEEPINYNQNIAVGLEVDNQLTYKLSLLKSDIAKADLKANHLMQLPTLSVLYYDVWQQNSNNMFFDQNAQWLNSQYIGLKLSLPFPDVNRFTQTKISKVNSTIALQNAEQTKLQNDNNNRQLILDYEKAFSQFTTAKQIYELKEQNYQLAVNQFNMDILSSDKLLIAFNDMIASRLNYSSALANLLYLESKIDINNTVK